MALQDTLQVHCAVAITEVDFGVTIRKVLIVERVWCRNTGPIQAVQLHTRRRQGFDQPFCVLPHEPAIFKADVLEEPVIVPERVVSCGCVHKYLFM